MESLAESEATEPMNDPPPSSPLPQ